MMKLSKTILLISIIVFRVSATPKLTVVLVIDQFAQKYMKKLGKNFNFAFKKLEKKGINYTDAHHPHGSPTTATGHNALNTGTLAHKHGIILNSWSEVAGKKIRYEDDDSFNRVFSVSGFQDYGKSAKNIMVPGLTEQFLKKSPKHKSYSLSYKSRAAIGMSGKKGKPIWFDENLGIFTSSGYFFNKMPAWLRKFNENNKAKDIKNEQWKTCYPIDSKYYKLKDINFHKDTGYKYARYDQSLISTDFVFTSTNKINKRFKNANNKQNFDGFLKSPLSNKLLLDLAKNCIEQNLKEDDKMLLWVSLSSLDKLGHVYGPQSIEVIDMIYHLDKQIDNFLSFLKNKIGKKDFLFVLTSDHGVEPLVELMQKKGKACCRINTNSIIDELNSFVEKKYKIKKIVKYVKNSQFYLDKNRIKKLSPLDKTAIVNDLKKIILNKNGLRNVWSYEELSSSKCKFDSYQGFYKKQLYPNRSGDLICMPEKYCTFNSYKYGVGHKSPYKYNTNVPLIIYRKNKFEKKVIDKKVWIPQLPVTLANILHLPKLNASEFCLLPLTNNE